MADLQTISQTLIAGNISELKSLVQQAIDQGEEAGKVLNAALVPGMDVVGERMENGLKDRVKVIVGGAPVTEKFAWEIGAEGYAPDAGSANKLARSLLQ